jgi:hypothetical protein
MHTPGPWEWRQFSHGVALTTVGRGVIIVMDFVRSGMHGATVRFGRRSRADQGGVMVKAEDWPEGIDQHSDARLIAASPDLLAACEATLAWLTNVNTNDPATLARQIMTALEKAGCDKARLDDAAVAIVRGPCSVPNLIGEEAE